MTVFLRAILVVTGCVSLGVGLVGIVVPLLPTTPFLLLAAACFLRSSDRLHQWLVDHRIFGSILGEFRDARGVSRQMKVRALVLAWISLGFSSVMLYLRLGAGPVWFSVAAAIGTGAIFATWYVLARVPTRS